MNEDKKLTDKQKKFCEEYVYDWNATRAAKEAGYSEETAKSQGSRLLTNVNLQTYIKHLKENVAEQAGISKLMVLDKLTDIIEQDISEELGVKDKIKALEVVNKMLGFNDPEQTVTKGSLEVKGIKPMKWVDDSGK